jgi:hypothetical protein
VLVRFQYFLFSPPAACLREDREGIVAKRKDGAYDLRASWVKINNPAYSQIIGRNEPFEKRSTG